MPDNHSADSTTNSVADLLRLPDAEFAREIGLNVSDPNAAPEEKATPTDDPVDAAVSDTLDEVAEVAQDDEPETPEEKPKAPDSKPEGNEKADPAKLATQFTAYDDDGEYDLSELAKVKIKFKANGKDRDEPLDKVVRLAQFGFHNEEVSKERDYLRGKALPDLTAERDQYKERFEDAQALAMRMIQDPDFYVETRDQMESRLTPEYRAQEAERRLAERDQQDQAKQRQAQSAEFTQTQIMPKLDSLMQEFPSVTPEEVLGMFTIATAPYARNGVVPPEAWGRVAQLVDGEIAARMATLHETRAAGQAAETKKSAAKVTKAQEEATKAKRTLARAVKAPSAGNNSSSARKAPAPRKIESAEDAIDSIMDDIASSLTG